MSSNAATSKLPAMTTTAQLLSISSSLIASGGIASISVFSIPQLLSQPASRSLPSIRWLFSRASHIFPVASFITSTGFAYLAYTALPPAKQALAQLFGFRANGRVVNGYLTAALLALSIFPFRIYVMKPTSFELIAMNEERGGARSQASADGRGATRPANGATDSVNSVGQAPEFTDLSGPQTKTVDETTEEDDAKVRELLGKFGSINLVRACLLGASGLVGLWTALTAPETS